MNAPLLVEGAGDVLLLCDHASNLVPAGIELGVASEVMGEHVAVDIGAEPLTRALAARLGTPAILATVSRLVIELHREPDHPALIPVESDQVAVPGNVGADRFDRIARFHAPYHAAVAAEVKARRPRLIVAIHSFTRQLRGAPPRTLEAGILYNRDDRAARVMIAGLRAAGIETGDNAPYSGRLLNATLDRHGEGRGIACVSIEVRNDLIADDVGVARWAGLLAPLIEQARGVVGGGG
ncbi:N-formylglutamate amidohydrolase [Sphingomonas spermidinifaciens]|uniref:N-formylglutamate amidohydrolase n=1 Tax=Sphingomonas spermidinifaciens TaxID=1141889 RepID=A0A2A4B7A5_9SPHN|nr:N-formylglutamate amidohydrolase [Sphingomonas spermidinifaciens]PCD03524.1 N-formylglutamate amidohydrolase [Sphingomonas spermidinifaciens]